MAKKRKRSSLQDSATKQATEPLRKKHKDAKGRADNTGLHPAVSASTTKLQGKPDALSEHSRQDKTAATNSAADMKPPPGLSKDQRKTWRLRREKSGVAAAATYASQALGQQQSPSTTKEEASSSTAPTTRVEPAQIRRAVDPELLRRAATTKLVLPPEKQWMEGHLKNEQPVASLTDIETASLAKPNELGAAKAEKARQRSSPASNAQATLHLEAASPTFPSSKWHAERVTASNPGHSHAQTSKQVGATAANKAKQPTSPIPKTLHNVNAPKPTALAQPNESSDDSSDEGSSEVDAQDDNGFQRPSKMADHDRMDTASNIRPLAFQDGAQPTPPTTATTSLSSFGAKLRTSNVSFSGSLAFTPSMRPKPTRVTKTSAPEPVRTTFDRFSALINGQDDDSDEDDDSGSSSEEACSACDEAKSTIRRQHLQARKSSASLATTSQRPSCAAPKDRKRKDGEARSDKEQSSIKAVVNGTATVPSQGQDIPLSRRIALKSYGNDSEGSSDNDSSASSDSDSEGDGDRESAPLLHAEASKLESVHAVQVGGADGVALADVQSATIHDEDLDHTENSSDGNVAEEHDAPTTQRLTAPVDAQPTASEDRNELARPANVDNPLASAALPTDADGPSEHDRDRLQNDSPPTASESDELEAEASPASTSARTPADEVGDGVVSKQLSESDLEDKGTSSMSDDAEDEVSLASSLPITSAHHEKGEERTKSSGRATRDCSVLGSVPNKFVKDDECGDQQINSESNHTSSPTWRCLGSKRSLREPVTGPPPSSFRNGTYPLDGSESSSQSESDDEVDGGWAAGLLDSSENACRRRSVEAAKGSRSGTTLCVVRSDENNAESQLQRELSQQLVAPELSATAVLQDAFGRSTQSGQHEVIDISSGNEKSDDESNDDELDRQDDAVASINVKAPASITPTHAAAPLSAEDEAATHENTTNSGKKGLPSFLGQHSGLADSGLAQVDQALLTPTLDPDDRMDDDVLYNAVDEITRDVLESTRPLPLDKPQKDLASNAQNSTLTHCTSLRALCRSRARQRSAKEVYIPAPETSMLENVIVYYSQASPNVDVQATPQDEAIAQDSNRQEHNDFVRRRQLPETGSELGSSRMRDPRNLGNGPSTTSVPPNQKKESSSSLSDLSPSPIPTQNPHPHSKLVVPDSQHEDKSSPPAQDDGDAIAQVEPEEAAESKPVVEARKKRKMTGMTSKHFSPDKKSTTQRSKKGKATTSSLDVNQQGDVLDGGVDAAAPTSEIGESTPAPKRSRPKRQTTGTKSDHFLPFDLLDRVDLPSPRRSEGRSPAGVSRSPVPPITSDHFGIVQEKLWDQPFWLLIAVTFLNQTTGRAAVPVFWALKERYPTPEILAKANSADILPMVSHLGLQNARSERVVKMAKTWMDKPPECGKRYKALNYPKRGDHSPYNRLKEPCIEGDGEDCKGALEISHMPGCGPYAFDSWRIFCRDVLRGVAEDYNGKAAPEGFEPEWKRVLPQDKELIATLRWMWLREGLIWDFRTGERRDATEEEMQLALHGQMDVQDESEKKFAERAVGIKTPPTTTKKKRAATKKAADDGDAAGSHGKDVAIVAAAKKQDDGTRDEEASVLLGNGKSSKGDQEVTEISSVPSRPKRKPARQRK
ncbi:hypothetical protein B0A50_05040 [Salinomyces thailandicus]|uniref:HhH-GPD domain-containing protein n=1 Tax=Salinomyces thailandicus TaxID=706561 RepID=A0A4U0TV88_9PEZI|nr:hypothetical protein B0A50_05040 [Salinomyces thailandica]